MTNMRHLSLAILLTLAPLASFAQQETEIQAVDMSEMAESKLEMEEVTPTKAVIRVTPQLGLSSLSYSGKDSRASSSEAAAGGLLFDLGEKNRVLQTGFLIFQSRSKANITENNVSTKQNVEANYLGLPLLAKFHVLGSKDKGMYLKAGMMAAFLNSAKPKSDVSPLDTLGIVGLGGQYALSKKTQFVLDGTYNQGFVDTLRTKGRTYNQGFMITTGVSFDL